MGPASSTCDLRMLQQLQQALRKGEWKVTVAVALRPPDHRASGRASTTEPTAWRSTSARPRSQRICATSSSGEVLASAGLMNPQIRFGEDLMSRVSYTMMNPGREIAAAVRDAVNELVGQLLESRRPGRPARVLEAVFVGNPVMHHLFLGLDPTELGGAPFAPAAVGGQALGERAWPQSGRYRRARLRPAVHRRPCRCRRRGGGLVGGAAPQRRPKPGRRRRHQRRDCARQPQRLRRVLADGAGFEGAQISSGQRAAPGAIERVRIDPATLEPRYRVIGSNYWSNEAEFAGSNAGIGVTGICGSGIIEVIGEMLLAGIISEDEMIGAPQTPEEEARIIPNGRTWSSRGAPREPAPAHHPE